MIDNQVEITIPDEVQKSWQQIVDITARLCEVPVSLIMRLAGSDIEVFKASQSPDNPYRPGAKEHFESSGLYCETVIKTGKELLVPDARADEEWRDNPDVKLDMISYLGFPITLPTGKPFGTICVLDCKRNEYSDVVEQLMSKFRDVIESELGLVFMNQTLGDRNKRLSDYLTELQALRGLVHICSHCKAVKNNRDEWKPIEHYLIKHPDADFSHGLCPSCMKAFYPRHVGNP